MISDFKIGDYVGLEDHIGADYGQVVATPDTDYSVGENYVKVLWLDPEKAPTLEPVDELLKLECEDTPVDTE